MTHVLSLQRPAAPSRPPQQDEHGFDAATITDTLARQLAATAVERDRAGGHAAHERALIRSSGLLDLSIPTAHGGLGGDWPTVYRSVRRLAQADSALAHLFGFHHLQVAGVLLYGDAAQQQRMLRETTEGRLFWGNALNPVDKRAVATRTASGWQVDGPKSFCSGSVGSDRLTISAWHEATQSLLIAAIPTVRTGVTVQADWDAFGQRQTDSGTVRFDAVQVADDEVLVAPGAPLTAQATLRSQVAQLVMANLYLGIAIGAFDEARAYTRTQSRPWFASGVEAAIDDPFIQHRYGELWLLVRPALAVADEAARALQKAFERGARLTAPERGAVAIAVAEAKVLSHRAGVEVSSQLFELTGARATSQRFGFDRYWRNVRVHTLHDPVDYKLRDLGRHQLDGRWPEPTAYS